MENKEPKKTISNEELDHGQSHNDFKVLAQKLKSIKETINLLEKHSLEKDI